jgi:mRNA interferase MazF
VPIQSHPGVGVLVFCDFNQGFRAPEMVKSRPAIIIAPKISVRSGLCTIVPLSTTPPEPVMPYHCKIKLDPPLPSPWDAPEAWVKGDLVNSVGFHRLDLVRIGKDRQGNRAYRLTTVPIDDLRRIRACVLCSLGLMALKKHTPLS